ncbi:tyrosine-protein phosphatase non-receptor type 13-like [Amphibalanus amphitrite]|uniref:tyrosine-protein phosphatase non-receptor type 13-like n=1 Tax=Amphibalanus amphitrite TaxID=1232801 RepID=UPI001C90466D|nr:tyrosine-protein phosphatase non-receptor type 13-like [Amphibalanus amphitrite]
MIRLMARESTSAENLATSTPNQSLVAPSGGATVAPPHGTLRRRRPVRRKPSALYGPRPGRPEPGERVFCGPEFVIRAREKPRRLDLTQKSSVSGCVLVILLNGQKLEIGCQPDTHTVADVTKAVFEEEPYPHPSLLGLAVSADGEFLFPPPGTRLNKALVSPAGGRQLTLYQRFKLYPTADTLPKSATGLHLLYLQLRQNLLENSLDVSSNQVVQLSSLALLAEFGDRSDKSCADSMIEDSGAAYFLPEHYLPEPLTSQAELLRQLTEGHVTCGSEQPGAAGQAGGPAAAERRFVRVAAGCRGYGRHRCSVDLRVKSYSTSTLSIDPSCLRLSRCDPSGRSTTRTLHWSTVSKIEYKHRSRRLIVNTAGAEAMTFCGEKAKLRCLEYMLQQHLTSFREGLHLTAGSGQPTQVYRARADPTSPQLTHYCVRTPLSSLTNRAATRHAVAANQKAASPDLKAAPVSAANQKPAPAGSTNGRTPAARRTNENAGSSPELTNQLEESPAAANRRRRSAGGPLRQRQVSRGAARWRSASQLAPGRPAAAARDGSPPANGIRMGTRVPVSALQRQKLRSREALPHLTDGAYVIAAEVPATPELTAPPGTRPVDGSTGDLRHTAGVFNITLHRCPRTGDLGVRVVRAAAAADGGLLTVETVTAAGPAGTRALIAGGDVITHISGCPLRPLSYSAAVDRLRRAVDPVTLTVIRRGDGGAASRIDSGASKRPADEDAGDGDDVSRGSLEKRLCRDGPGRESVNDLVIGRLTRQLSGDCLATPEGKR